MAIDFSALEERPAGDILSAGKPLMLRLDDIEEDESQPRQEFDIADILASIRAKVAAGQQPIKTPISVKVHPTKLGKWVLNDGARRYRSAKEAGLVEIPAFVDEDHDDYDQVIVNIQRESLTPIELALFIKKRKDAGDNNKTIAQKLGKDGAYITQHLALIDPPDCVINAYRSGQCTSPKTLYELRGLQEKYPEQVDAWCSEATEITRKTVSDLADVLKGGKKNKKSAQELGEGGAGTSATVIGHDQTLGGNNESDAGAPKKSPPTKKNNGEGEGDGGKDLGELTSWPKGRAISDPDRMSKPLMMVDIDGRSAAVLLNRRPSADGMIIIRFEDGGGDQEVDASACTIKLLTESEK